MRQISLLCQEVQEVLHGLGYEVAQARIYLACDVCFGYLINVPEYTVAWASLTRGIVWSGYILWSIMPAYSLLTEPHSIAYCCVFDIAELENNVQDVVLTVVLADVVPIVSPVVCIESWCSVEYSDTRQPLVVGVSRLKS